MVKYDALSYFISVNVLEKQLKLENEKRKDHNSKRNSEAFKPLNWLL